MRHVCCAAVLWTFAVALDADAAAPRRELRRAAPPAKWGRVAESRFEADAFTLLEGERPASFDRAAATAIAPGGPSAGTNGDEPRAGDGDFDRRDMMKKIEAAEQSLAELLSSDKAFRAGGARAAQHADLVIMMGRTLFSGDPDYGEDDTYLKHAEDMASLAKQLKVLSKKGDYDGATAVFGRLKTTCNACHEAYR